MIIIMTGQHASESGEQVTGQSASVPQIHSERFDTKEVATVAGVDVGKLQNWLTRGVIQLRCELNPGRGQSREYAPYEVARIRLMKKLADVGVPLSTAFKLTDALKKAWGQVPGGHEAYGIEPHLQAGSSSWMRRRGLQARRPVWFAQMITRRCGWSISSTTLITQWA